jgi:hypothetical protein
MNSSGANDSLKVEKRTNNEGHFFCKTSIPRGNALTGTLLRMLSQTRRKSSSGGKIAQIGVLQEMLLMNVAIPFGKGASLP